ncbi:Gfo/Idh/MocA family protein [Falsirhodobacter algicola]|uniref:Gfo/Idh/MocA family oxidoreductase n=1 Tax=Falsirhodobacter algicola TaxID=2692330 RepID=A0A8J8MRH6_9RHOB|nr:Gfo/Idh/MocA family oxidoreductase [Falsirhodobacter algicola]QUS35104.1 Gfo/Idh/MocA family oxidoreductase [Falsirhodobacter algicola]
MIRIGLAGYGYWGPNLARAVAVMPNARVEMIADMSPPARERAGRAHPAARLTPSIAEMIADPAVDAVMIATPVSTHFDLAMAALRAGKHVLVEKPMAETADRARMLIEEAARRRLILMVDHTFVYTGAVQAIAGLIETGEIGDLYYYDSTRVNLGLFQRDVNVIWDLAVHDFAIMERLIKARPVAISASAAGFLNGSPENMAHLSVYYDDGAMAHLNVNWLAPVKIRQTLIGGSRKMVIYDDMQTSEKVKIYDRGAEHGTDPYERMVSYRLGEMRAPALSAREALVTETEEFLRCIETGATPLTDGASGLRVVEMLEAASRSTRMRGFPIDLVTLKEAS